ncbi:MAG: permease [Candidatus Izemoplasmataceae bacterium]
MSIEGMIIYGIAIILTLLSLIKSKEKTVLGLKKGAKSFFRLMPVLLPLFLFIGILLTLVTPAFISSILGEDSGLFGYVFGLTVGSITFMPPFVAYPLGQNLLDSGAAYPQVAGFLVALMSVGLVYFQVESRYFNKKSALFRNLVSLIGAVIVIGIVSVIYA